MKRWMLAALLLVALPVASAGWAMNADLHPFSRGSWKTLRKMHEGQATIVHFWGISCGPCMAELKKWAALAARRPGRNLVMVDADPIPDDPDSVARTLSRYRLAAVENWIFTDPFQEKLRYEVDPHWGGEMPYTVLIARDGATSSITGLVDFSKLDAWLDTQK